MEQWARDAKIHDNDRELFSIDTLEPIIQAAALLQVRICLLLVMAYVLNFSGMKIAHGQYRAAQGEMGQAVTGGTVNGDLHWKFDLIVTRAGNDLTR